MNDFTIIVRKTIVATLKEVRILAAIEPPTCRRECYGLVFPNLPGCRSTFNKPWHMQKVANTVLDFHTEGNELDEEQVAKLADLSPITDNEFNNFSFKIIYSKVWVK